MSRNVPIRRNVLNGLQVKDRIEFAISYDHSKFKNMDMLFTNKKNGEDRLPFSDYKISISKELLEREALIENLNKLLTFRYQEAQYKKKLKLYEEYLRRKEELDRTTLPYIEEPEIIVEEEKEVEEEVVFIAPVEEVVEEELVSVVDSSVEVDKTSKTTILSADTLSVIEKIKAEAIAKNQGKKTLGRREINKMLLDKNKVVDQPVEAVVEEVVEPTPKPAPKPRKKPTVKVLSADTNSVLAKIKAEAIAKNEGKKVVGRREIDQMIEKENRRKRKTLIETTHLDSITSIDIYLTAVDKINLFEEENKKKMKL